MAKLKNLTSPSIDSRIHRLVIAVKCTLQKEILDIEEPSHILPACLSEDHKWPTIICAWLMIDDVAWLPIFMF